MAKKRTSKKSSTKGLDQDNLYKQGTPASLRRAAERRDLTNQIAQEQKVDRERRKQLGMMSSLDRMSPRDILLDAEIYGSSKVYGKNRKLSGVYAYGLYGGAGGKMLRNPEALRKIGEIRQSPRYAFDREKNQVVEKTKLEKSRRGRGKTPKR